MNSWKFALAIWILAAGGPGAESPLLGSGQRLVSPAFLQSANGVFRLMRNQDGNWGVYGRSEEGLECNWETGSDDPSSSLILENTGVVRVVSADQRSLWRSGYEGMIGSYHLVLRDNGDLVVEQWLGNEWRFCWSSLQGYEGHYRASPGLRLDRRRGRYGY